MKNKKSDYLPFEEWVWKSYDGKRVVDIKEFIATHNDEDRYFMIGTDSQNYSKKRMCIFTSVVISYKVGRGGTVIIHRDRVPYMQHLRQRLMLEAMRSLEVAWYIEPLVAAKNVIEIHLDVNPSLSFNSGKYKDELIGLIASQGFAYRIKPDACAASSTADRKC